PSDVVAPRDHGLTAFHETGLDGRLRSAGVRTVVLTGVSINIAITGAAIDAVNRGYTAVIPTDCVAGYPPEFARDAVKFTPRNLAYLTPSGESADLGGHAEGGRAKRPRHCSAPRSRQRGYTDRRRPDHALGSQRSDLVLRKPDLAQDRLVVRAEIRRGPA